MLLIEAKDGNVRSTVILAVSAEKYEELLALPFCDIKECPEPFVVGAVGG